MSCSPGELKNLRRFPVPASALEAGKKRLLIAIAEAPFVPGATKRKSAIFSWKPAMATLVVTVFVVSGGGMVFASQGSLPGDKLYSVKRAAERMHARLILSETRTFAVQAAHAERRLMETEKLMQRESLLPEERVERVQTALRAYDANLFVMNAMAVKMSVHPPSTKKGKRAVQQAEHLLDRQAALVASATVTQPIVTDAVLAPVDDAIELQSDVFSLLSSFASATGTKQGDVERDDLEHRHRERSEGIERNLKTLRFELDRRKSLEIR